MTEFSAARGAAVDRAGVGRLRAKAISSYPCSGRQTKIGRVLWAWRTIERYGPLAHTGYRVGSGVWARPRRVRSADRARSARSAAQTGETGCRKRCPIDRARFRLTQACSCWRSAAPPSTSIPGRLALSADEIDCAKRDAADAAAPELSAPVRLLLSGQINAGKSSLVNALAHEVRSAVGTAADHLARRNTESRWTAGRRCRSSTLPGIGETRRRRCWRRPGGPIFSCGWHRRPSRRAVRTAAASMSFAPGQLHSFTAGRPIFHRGVDAHRRAAARQRVDAALRCRRAGRTEGRAIRAAIDAAAHRARPPGAGDRAGRHASRPRALQYRCPLGPHRPGDPRCQAGATRSPADRRTQTEPARIGRPARPCRPFSCRDTIAKT